ncbi:hypothetical protein [Kitasatospora sp. NPDC057198]|uniref:hypothetical protein n=1 Tax=Kitasatospora sp. NPDC057198 TaxID=3346046 RepID=UPI003639FD44
MRCFDRTELAVDTGIALGRLGETRAAEALIAGVLRAGPVANLRGRAFHAFWLTRVRLRCGEVESACEASGRALDLAAAVESPRVVAHLRELRRELGAHRGAPGVVELVGRIAELPG